MPLKLESIFDELRRDGFAMLSGLFGAAEMGAVADELTLRLNQSDDPSVLRSHGEIYGVRDVAALVPEIASLARTPALDEFVTAVLGPTAGIVRILYFDKPPTRSWSLPWHRDQTIAVKRNDLPSQDFQKPTFKAGVPHIEAPRYLLEQMLTLRIHLDAMTALNGPLSVVPESHRRDVSDRAPIELNADVGDVLAMRPLLSHSSRMSVAGTTMRRRIVHFEIASSPTYLGGRLRVAILHANFARLMRSFRLQSAESKTIRAACGIRRTGDNDMLGGDEPIPGQSARSR